MYVPLKSHNPFDNPFSFSNNLISSLRVENRAHWLYKLSLKLEDFVEFKRLRAICIRKRKECYAIYSEKIQSTLKFNMKSFGSSINSKRKFRKIPNPISLGGVEAYVGNDVANLFASHFESSYSTSSQPISSTTLSCSPAKHPNHSK